MKETLKKWCNKNRVILIVTVCIAVGAIFILFGEATVEKPNPSCHATERNFKCK